MLGIPQKSARSNYYGTDVRNNSDYYIPESILEQAAQLRQLILDAKLEISITINTQPE